MANEINLMLTPLEIDSLQQEKAAVAAYMQAKIQRAELTALEIESLRQDLRQAINEGTRLIANMPKKI